MSHPSVIEKSIDLYSVGPYALRIGGLVGEDAQRLLVPIECAVRFLGVTKESRPSSSQSPVGIERSGIFTFGFVGWTPTFRDRGRSVWAFSETEVAGAPLGTAFEVGRNVGFETTEAGRPGVRVEIAS